MKCIDLNCDMGEMPEALANGSQETLMRYISSANIACGGHAGDVGMMRKTIEQALRHRVAIGAHPGYEDPANFGRIELQLVPEQISASVLRQLLVICIRQLVGHNSGGVQQSPEWIPASSICCMIPPIITVPVLSRTASTSNSNASSKKRSIRMG